jgi:hypothetical protein
MIKEIRINDDEQHIPREIVIKVKISNFLFFFKKHSLEFFRQQQKNYLIYLLMNNN